MSKSKKASAKRSAKTKQRQTNQGIDLSHMADCILDASEAEKSGLVGPADPLDYEGLRRRLEAAKDVFPPLYSEGFVQPYIAKINDLRRYRFNGFIARDEKLESTGRLLMDGAHAILQVAERYEEQATRAFQELISDLYDGFLSAADRRKIRAPDRGTTPPLVKWGCPDWGPYTWTVEGTAWLGVKAGVVSLPPANAKRDLLAWAVLAHETTGHGILAADSGLLNQLHDAVRDKVAPVSVPLADYWSSRIDETASDVLGILNMGPAAAIGVVCHLRGSRLAQLGEAKLYNFGSWDDEHPADILRGYLAAETIRLLAFEGRTAWADTVLRETQQDVTKIRVKGRVIQPALAHQSAKLVAEVIANHECDALERHALSDIQNWRDRDEAIVEQIRQVLRAGTTWKYTTGSLFYATHVAAAAVLEGLASGTNETLFGRMLDMLCTMHDHNPSWRVARRRQDRK